MNIFQAFSQLQVLLIGDVMIDRYVSGQVHRISPEAPVPVLNFQKTEDRLGGAANVALNIKAMGATPYLCSVIGSDKNGQTFSTLLKKKEINTMGIVTSKERRTTTKTRFLAHNQHLLRMDEEDTFDLTTEEITPLVEAIEKLYKTQKIDVVLFQDYNKGIITPILIQTIIKLAQKYRIPVAVDPKFHNFWTYRNITLFKPNLKEVQDALPFDVSPHLASLQKAAQYIHQRLQNTYTLITLSDKGLFIYDHDRGINQIIPTIPRQITDVCGAGDTVISIAALGLGLNLDIRAIARLANLAGGQVCEQVGVVSVDKQMLEKEYLAMLK